MSCVHNMHALAERALFICHLQRRMRIGAHPMVRSALFRFSKTASKVARDSWLEFTKAFFLDRCVADAGEAESQAVCLHLLWPYPCCLVALCVYCASSGTTWCMCYSWSTHRCHLSRSTWTAQNGLLSATCPLQSCSQKWTWFARRRTACQAAHSK